jgi:hypothetical protein
MKKALESWLSQAPEKAHEEARKRLLEMASEWAPE